MTGEDIAWFAGLFEGEGSIFAGSNGKRDPGPVFTMTIAMTDRDVIEKVVSVTGVGNIYGPYDTSYTKKLWRWRLRGRDAIEQLTTLIRPWLGQRRKEQIDQAQARFTSRRFAAGTRGAQIKVEL